MQTKNCTKCKEEKPALKEFFHSATKGKYGLSARCKICISKQSKQEYIKNKDLVLESRKEHYLKNKDEKLAKQREYYSKNKHLKQQYRAKNKEKIQRYYREKTASDQGFRILTNTRSRVRQFLNGSSKSENTKKLIGCTQQQFVAHLEDQFTDKMNWGNYGEYWNIDHIIPCNAYDPTVSEDQKRCFNYKNTRPLKDIDNIIKSDDLDLKLIKQHKIEHLLPTKYGA